MGFHARQIGRRVEGEKRATIRELRGRMGHCQHGQDRDNADDSIGSLDQHDKASKRLSTTSDQRPEAPVLEPSVFVLRLRASALSS